MIPMPSIRVVEFNADELADVERVIDAAVRYGGVRAVRDAAAVIFALDTPLQGDGDGSSRYQFAGHTIASVHRIADYACRGRGFEIAEIAIAFVHRVITAPMFHDDGSPAGLPSADETTTGAPVAIGPEDPTLVDGQIEEGAAS